MRFQELAVALWWLVAAPVFAYTTIEHTLAVRTPGQHSLAVFLGTLGLGIYAVHCAQRSG